MNYLNNKRGSIPIFLLLIFLSLIILVTSLVDYSSVYYSRNHVEQVVNIAARNVLSEYDATLKELYGIYGFKDHRVDEKIEYYISEMLVNNRSESHNYKIKQLSSFSESSRLNNEDLFYDQMINEMKYKGLIGGGNGFEQKIDMVMNASSSIQLLEKTGALYSQLHHLDYLINILRSNVEGYGIINEQLEYRANFINKTAYSPSLYLDERDYLTNNIKNQVRKNVLTSNILSDTRKEYIVYTKLYLEHSISLRKYKYINDNLTYEINLLENEDVQKGMLISKRLENQNQINKIKNKIKALNYPKIKKEYEQLLIKMISTNENALYQINQIENEIAAIRKTLEQVNEMIMIQEDSIIPGFLNQIAKSIEQINNAIHIDKEQQWVLKEKQIEKNIELLKHYEQQVASDDLIDLIEQLSKSEILGINNSEEYVKNEKAIITWEKNIVEMYEKLSLGYESNIIIKPLVKELFQLTNRTNNSKDHLNIILKVIKQRLSEWINNSSSIVLINNTIKNLLPSTINNKTNGTGLYQQVEYVYPGLVDVSILKEMTDLFDISSINLGDIRNELFGDAYIMSFFNNRLADDISKTQSYYQSEVEYILNGHYSESANNQIMVNKLMYTRTGMNSIHIYMDPVKRNEAFNIAMEISSGAGTYLGQLIVTLIWANAEAMLDLEELLSGEEVPFLKKDEDWELDIHQIGYSNLTNNSKKKRISEIELIEDINKFNYEDYLRLFLFFENKKDKIQRTMDIVQINMTTNYDRGFQVRDYYGGLEISATIQVPYLFLNRVKFLDHYDIKNKEVNVNVYHAYY